MQALYTDLHSSLLGHYCNNKIKQIVQGGCSEWCWWAVCGAAAAKNIKIAISLEGLLMNTNEKAQVMMARAELQHC